MGGHGGLNILPQKKWNVYNFDNREKVRKDEESAAKEEQLKREQSRRRDSEVRLQQLRRTRHLVADSPPPPPPEVVSEAAVKDDSKHINLFEGIKIFDPIMVDEKKRKRRDEEENDRRKKMMKSMRMKKEEVREVGPEDEKYRLGYGVVGKGVKAPWYAVKRDVVADDGEKEGNLAVKVKKTVKKSVEELREERLKREMVEKERERALLSRIHRGGGRRRFSR